VEERVSRQEADLRAAQAAQQDGVKRRKRLEEQVSALESLVKALQHGKTGVAARAYSLPPGTERGRALSE